MYLLRGWVCTFDQMAALAEPICRVGLLSAERISAERPARGYRREGGSNPHTVRLTDTARHSEQERGRERERERKSRRGRVGEGK